MMALLVTLLIWILLGGVVYLIAISDIDIGYKIWREQGKPVAELTKLLNNKRILTVCLVFGPVILLLALCSLICE